jgi:Dolichyl-phosphate-mannose-protein mannosyltransferase
MIGMKEKKIILLFAFLTLVLHLFSNAFANYGIFRDEFYYIACANRLDLGYVDQPPFSIYVLAIIKFLFGDSLFVIRFLPAVLHGVIVYLAGLMSLKMGGGKASVIISCIAVALAPEILGTHSIYSMNAFDFLFWSLTAYILILIIQEEKKNLWVLLGLVLGLGLLNKVGVLWLCFGVFIALLLTTSRKYFKTFSSWLAFLIAFVIFIPFIVWNFTHDFAHIEFIQNALKYKYSGLTAKDFIVGQFMNLNPFSSIVWIAGLYFFFFNKEGKKYMLLGILYLAAFLILLLNGHSKSEYLAPAYPMLFAGGGILIEKISQLKNWHWCKYAVIVLLLASGILFMPFALPVLPVETYINYSKALGQTPSTPENKELGELPQFYADMFGWEGLAKDVSDVYKTLPEDEKKTTVVFCDNYGEAGAIEYYNKKYEVPEVICPHNNYWYWWDLNKKVTTIIVLGGKQKDHYDALKEVNLAGVHKSKYCMPYENNLSIFVCRGLRVSPEEIHSRIKNFN